MPFGMSKSSFDGFRIPLSELRNPYQSFGFGEISNSRELKKVIFDLIQGIYTAFFMVYRKGILDKFLCFKILFFAHFLELKLLVMNVLLKNLIFGSY